MTTQTRQDVAAPLVAHLIHLAETADKLSESRAALAELRRGLEEPLWAAKHVVPGLPADLEDQQRVRWLYTIAALFAWHQNHQKGVSLGAAFRAIQARSDSTEGRFLALLAARPEQLEPHLRHAVRLLASSGVALDWYRLADDVLHWGDEGKRRQHALARDFYRSETPADDEAGDRQGATPEGEPKP